MVVEEPAGADRVVPDLHLGAAPEVDARVALGADLPVDVELDVAVILGGDEAVPLAVVAEDAAFDGRPVALGLPLVAPVGQVRAVEEGDEARRRGGDVGRGQGDHEGKREHDGTP